MAGGILEESANPAPNSYSANARVKYERQRCGNTGRLSFHGHATSGCESDGNRCQAVHSGDGGPRETTLRGQVPMPVLPQHRGFRRIRRAESQQRWRMADSRVDRGLVEKPAGASSGHHRASPQFHRPRSERPDCVSDDFTAGRQAAKIGRVIWSASLGPGGWSMRLRNFIFVLSLLVLDGLSGCRKPTPVAKADPLLEAYDSEPDWSDSTKLIPLGYRQAQGKRVFYQYCVWCHADATPAGPSNRSNLTPMAPLMNDGEKLNNESDEYIQNIVTLGGGALGKSAMMPPYGKTLSPNEISAVMAFTRAIAQPSYKKPGRPGSQYSAK